MAITSLKLPGHVANGPFYIPFVDFMPSLDAWDFMLFQNNTLGPYLNSVIVALSSTILATLIGFAVGGVLAVYRFPGRGAVAAILNALMGLPPVVAGLIVYLLLSNAGPLGVLPYHYTLLLAERLRARDSAPAAFFDLFHHRIISLFYRAWEKYRFTVAYERGEEDALTVHLRDLAGVGLEEARKHLPIPADALLLYTGLLGPQPRGAQALEQLLADYFGLPVEVEQFVGRWYPIPKWDQCELGAEDGLSNQLGLGAVAGLEARGEGADRAVADAMRRVRTQ